VIFLSEEKIKITKEDLRSKKVEEVLEQHAALEGDVEFLHNKPKPRVSIFMSSWFYLLIAGLLGACITWSLLEPHYSDGVRITGTISRVYEESPIPGYKKSACSIEIKGKRIYVYEKTLYRGSDNKGEQVDSFSSLREGQNAYVVCEIYTSSLAVASGVKISPVPFQAGKNDAEKGSSGKSMATAFLLFPLLGALIGLCVGCADGLLSRTYLKALKAGGLGMLIGGAGGLISGIIASIFYAILGALVGSLELNPFTSAPGFILQVVRRTVAWSILGMTLGLGQGIALKSKKMVLNGFLGGTLGALMGGLLFDPIDILVLSKGQYDPFRTAGVSRLVGFLVTGGFVGFMIGLVEQLNKDAWLVMTEGPIKGKQFILYKDVTRIGSSPACEIYLFKDPAVAPEHAVIRKIHDGYLLIDNSSKSGVTVNGRKRAEHKLDDGDLVQVGKARFSFSLRKTGSELAQGGAL
jgi:hypothetical protein